MRTLWRGLAAALLAWTMPAALAETKAWQDTLTLPTWLEGPPETSPRLDSLDPTRSKYYQANYPYPTRSNFLQKKEPREWRRLNLENEYLACSFLPDLGGHLYSCIDKLNGLPIFHANSSIKKADIAVRGAWAAVGIEWNFPVAHSRDTVSPVNFGFRQEKGRAVVWVGNVDRVTGMEWLAEFVLRDGSAVLEENVTLRNPTGARRPYLWWANAGVGLDAGTRFVFPMHVTGDHGFKSMDSWPRSQAGVDLSNPATARQEITAFAFGSREPFMAVYNVKSRTAAVHVADPGIVTGKKLYSWGDNDLPRKWLSDDNTFYVEMQAGLFTNQETYAFLQPHQQTQFTELWMAGRDLGGVTRANQHAILNFARQTTAGKSALTVELDVTHAIPGAHIQVWDGKSLALDEKAGLTPSAKYSHSIADPQQAAYRFELRDAAGALLMSHTEGVYEAVGASDVKLGAQPPNIPGMKREALSDFSASGEYNEEHSNFVFAEGDYRAGLEKFPKDAALRKALGRLLAERQRYPEAVAELSQAVSALALDPELRYYLGLALSRTGKDDEARKSWAIAVPDAQFGPAALEEMAASESRDGHADAALALALETIKRNAASLTARKLQVALLRRAGKAEEARARLEEARAVDPVDSFLRLEGIRLGAIQLGAKDDALWIHLAADPERVLDIAQTYFDFGMYPDAMTVLEHTYLAVPENQTEPGSVLPQDYPLVAYYRGYCRQRLGQSGAADFKLASSQRLEYVFPNRAGSLPVLQAAIHEDGADAAAHFLLGLLYLNGNSIDNAVTELQAARSIRKDIPELYFALGGALLSQKDGKSAAISVLQEGVAAVHSQELKDLLASAIAPPKPPPVTATSAPPPAAPPRPKPATPEEAAVDAMDLTAFGALSTAREMFTPENLHTEKAPESVRRAYVEYQLQLLRIDAANHKCTEALHGLETLGSEDQGLPFTLNGGFDPFMKSARFQYYLGAVEALCGDRGAARRRWSKVAKMTPEISSPDFPFPLVAAQSLAANGKGPDIQPWLDKVSAALQSAGDDAKGTLLYSKGVLLLALGREGPAIAAFQEGAGARNHDLSHYLNALALRDAQTAVRASK